MRCAVIVFAVTLGAAGVVGCSSGTSSTGFDDGGGTVPLGGGSGASSGGSRGGGASGSSNGSSPSATYVDGGVACGMAGGCAPSQTCCYPAAMMTAMGGPPPGPSCVAQGSCPGSYLACSSTQHCSSGSVCCFAFGGSDGGAGPGGLGGGFGGGPFSAQCGSQCSMMGTYQLCADSSECTGGGMCVQGPYARYCAVGPMRGGRDAAGSD
jgi:hypothetical protein